MSREYDSILKAVIASTAVLGLYIETLYNLTFKIYLKSLLVEEYSYIIVSLGLIIIILLFEYRNIRFSSSADPGRILSSITLIILSYTLLITSDILDTYIMVFKGLSLLTLIWGILILVIDRASFKRLLYPMIFLFALIPLPRDIIDPLSNTLSFYTASLTSLITGASSLINREANMYILKVTDPSGVTRSFNIAPICSGYISIMSILSSSIIVLYIALNSRESLSRKLYTIIISLVIGVLIVFTGNLLRISLVIWITRYISYDLALNVFHSLPSIIYSGLAALIVMIISFRLLRWGGDVDGGLEGYRESISSTPVLSILVVALLSTSIFLYTYNLNIGSTPGYSFNTMEDLLTNTTNILFRDIGGRVRYIVDESALAEALGASIVKRFGLEYNNSIYQGYIEVAESPARYHSWVVCLTVQGYIINSTWSVKIRDRTYTFISFHKGLSRYLIGYSIYRYRVSIGGVETAAYIRVSLMKPGIASEKPILNILSRIGGNESPSYPGFDNLMFWANITIIFTAVSIAYILGSIIVKYRRHLRISGAGR